MLHASWILGTPLADLSVFCREGATIFRQVPKERQAGFGTQPDPVLSGEDAA